MVEQLKPEELDAHVAAGTFRLAFVGMSNGGKSYRSRILRDELDFFWYEVDAHIQGALGFEDMDDISGWLGYPTSETFVKRAAEYLAAEEQCTHLAGLDTEGKNLVFDTTGSVIYISHTAKEWLLEQCLVVHIDVGEDAIEEFSARYFAEPKPVLWGGSFNQQPGEDDMAALKRCYPELLKDRLKKYRDFAHISVPLSAFFDQSAIDTLSVIKRHL